MKYIYLLILGIIFYSCSASDQNNTGQQNNPEINPCKDSLYLIYRAEPPDALTAQQQKYVKEKDKECQDYRKQQAENEKKERENDPNKNFPMIMGIVLVGLILITFLIVANK
jgi:hypothetical protein